MVVEQGSAKKPQQKRIRVYVRDDIRKRTCIHTHTGIQFESHTAAACTDPSFVLDLRIRWNRPISVGMEPVKLLLEKRNLSVFCSNEGGQKDEKARDTG